jgi:hypothetical protein
MPVLGTLTITEAGKLFWQLIGAIADVNRELDALERCPKAIRDDMYGRDCLEHYQGIRDDLVDLVADELTLIRL